MGVAPVVNGLSFSLRINGVVRAQKQLSEFK